MTKTATPTPRASMLSQHGTAWAIMPDTLADLVAWARQPSELTQTETEAFQRVRAAMGQDGQRVAGAVAVIQLRGVITARASFLSMLFGGGNAGLEWFIETVGEVADNDDVGSIVLDIDSPGGSCALVPEAAAAVRAAAQAKPVVAIANTTMASAAYWIASQAREIVATPSAYVGAIGTVYVHWDWSKFNDELGVIPTYVAAGKYKTERNPDAPLDDTAQEAIQADVNDWYELFVADVATGRGVTADEVRDGFGQARVLNAQRSLEAGLVDRIEALDETVNRLVTSSTSGSPQPQANADLITQAVQAALERQGATPPAGVTPEGSEGEPGREERPATESTPPPPPWLVMSTPRHR